MIRLHKDQVNKIFLTLFEDTQNKCEELFYLFEIKSKNKNEFTEVILEDMSSLEQRLRFNEFEFDLIDDEDLKELFSIDGTYVFNVYEYDNENEIKLNKIIQSGMFYIDSVSNFIEETQPIDYFIY
jgi:hypothetical protein